MPVPMARSFNPSITLYIKIGVRLSNTLKTSRLALQDSTAPFNSGLLSSLISNGPSGELNCSSWCIKLHERVDDKARAQIWEDLFRTLKEDKQRTRNSIRI